MSYLDAYLFAGIAVQAAFLALLPNNVHYRDYSYDTRFIGLVVICLAWPAMLLALAWMAAADRWRRR